MNKLYLWGIIVTAAMLGATYATVGYQKGGLNGDIINKLAIAGAVALVIITVFVVIKYVRQMQTDTADGELAEESWDNIGEYKNPLPFGWAVIFLGTMVWGMWYWVIGYPVDAYSQIGEYNEDVAAHDAKFNAQYASIKGPRLVEMGESVFLTECVVCHGLSADGIDGQAANLNERISFKSVKYAIDHGLTGKLIGTEAAMPDRSGLMNANNNYAPITDKEIDEVSKYVADGFKDKNSAGAKVFAGTCTMCHGANGEGVAGMAPQIDGWNSQLIVNVLDYGKVGAIGRMPVMDRLNSKQKEAAAAYVMSLSEGK